MMQQAAVAWQVYLLTHSPVALGMLGLVRVVPIIVLAVGAGVVVDALDRRKMLIVTQSTLLLLSAALAVLTYTGIISLWSIYALSALAAVAGSFDNPARQAIIPALVPRDVLANALSINSISGQIATVVGPSLAGLVIAAQGVGAVYAVDSVSYLAVLFSLIVIHVPAVKNPVQKVSLEAAIEGLRFVVSTPIILATTSLDFVATFFGSATALLPIFARDILHIGSEGYGLLFAAPAIGAVGAGVLMSFISTRIRAKGPVIIVSVMAYGACTVIFGLSHTFVISLLALAGTGAADTVSMILRQTIRQLATPDHLRGRMTSVTMMFFMGGPQLGEAEAGLVARAGGAPLSVVIGGVAALAGTVLVAVLIPRLRQYRD